MNATKLLLVSMLLMGAVLTGCGTHPVRCDGKLTPINTPASSEHQSAIQGSEP